MADATKAIIAAFALSLLLETRQKQFQSIAAPSRSSHCLQLSTSRSLGVPYANHSVTRTRAVSTAPDRQW